MFQVESEKASTSEDGIECRFKAELEVAQVGRRRIPVIVSMDLHKVNISLILSMDLHRVNTIPTQEMGGVVGRHQNVAFIVCRDVL